jgi:hypothetical protein
MAWFDWMLEGRRRRIEGSVIGRDEDIDVDFVAFIQFESADDDDSVGFPSDNDNNGAVGCLGADSQQRREDDHADGGMHVGGAVERRLVLRRAGRVRAGGGGGVDDDEPCGGGDVSNDRLALLRRRRRQRHPAQGCDTDCVGTGHDGIGQQRRR